jgi:hypothetical protein
VTASAPVGWRETEIQICPDPVFVIGSPRSGTAALAWSLAKHPDFWTGGEAELLSDLFGGGVLESSFERRASTSGGWLARHGVGREDFLAYVGLGLNALFTSRSVGARWIEKAPANTLMADTVADLFPGALFVHILRDGRRVAHSMINFASHETRSHLGAIAEPWMTDFRASCRCWRTYVEAAVAFEVERPHRCLTVLHEALVREPDVVLRRVLEFLGARHDDAPAEHLRMHRINSSFGDVKGDASGVLDLLDEDPWREWPPERRRIFVEECGETLVGHGFGDEEDLRL